MIQARTPITVNSGPRPVGKLPATVNKHTEVLKAAMNLRPGQWFFWPAPAPKQPGRVVKGFIKRNPNLRIVGYMTLEGKAVIAHVEASDSSYKAK